MSENDIRQQQPIIAFGVNNIGCDQRGAMFQTIVPPTGQAVVQEDAGTDAACSTSYAQSNIIFSARIFLREEHYARLRGCILSSVKDIDAMAQNEWYYIMKGMGEADVVSRNGFTPTRFVEQMVAWFPDLFVPKAGEDRDKMVRRYMSSISHEGTKWLSGMERREVPIRDMFAHRNTMGYGQAWTLHVHGVADGLRKALSALKEEIEKERAKH